MHCQFNDVTKNNRIRLILEADINIDTEKEVSR